MIVLCIPMFFSSTFFFLRVLECIDMYCIVFGQANCDRCHIRNWQHNRITDGQFTAARRSFALAECLCLEVVDVGRP